MYRNSSPRNQSEWHTFPDVRFNDLPGFFPTAAIKPHFPKCYSKQIRPSTHLSLVLLSHWAATSTVIELGNGPVSLCLCLLPHLPHPPRSVGVSPPPYSQDLCHIVKPFNAIDPPSIMLVQTATFAQIAVPPMSQSKTH